MSFTNTGLVGPDGLLCRNLQYGVDFYVVAPKVWQALAAWYVSDDLRMLCFADSISTLCNIASNIATTLALVGTAASRWPGYSDR